MRKSSFRLRKNASVSLISILERAKQDLAPASAAALAGYEGRDRSRVQEIDRTTVLIEANNPDQVAEDLIQGGHCDDLEVLAKHFVSARVGTNAIQRLLDMSSVQRIQTKKLSQPLLEDAVAEIGARQAGQRTVAEDGNNVLIGIVDTGFDLSHPMFRDVNNDLRVEALLDQTDGNKEYDTNSLTADWGASGSKPGNDLDGHGTHVASIAGGTEFQGHEGVAPGARFLLVKTNFIDTDRAAS